MAFRHRDQACKTSNAMIIDSDDLEDLDAIDGSEQWHILGTQSTGPAIKDGEHAGDAEIDHNEDSDSLGASRTGYRYYR